MGAGWEFLGQFEGDELQVVVPLDLLDRQHRALLRGQIASVDVQIALVQDDPLQGFLVLKEENKTPQEFVFMFGGNRHFISGKEYLQGQVVIF